MKYIIFLAVASTLLAVACKKNTFSTTERSVVEGKTFVKFGLFSMYPTSTALTIFGNNMRITAAIASPYGYPGGGFNTGGSSYADYLALNPGNLQLGIKSIFPNSDYILRNLLDTSYSFELDKKYTLLVADTGIKTTSILLRDDFPTVDSGYAYFRLVNLIPNSDSLDFYKNDSLIFPRIGYKQAQLIKLRASVVDTFTFRPKGAPGGPAVATGTPPYYRLATNTNQRIYTLVSRGFIGNTGASNPQTPAVSVIINK